MEDRSWKLEDKYVKKHETKYSNYER